MRFNNKTNTIVVNNGSTSLHNTDYKGFLAEVSRLNFKTENKTVLILGSGGSSKSIKYALTRLNPKEVYVASRNPNGKQLGYSDLSLIKEKVNMIVNTTPLGMPPYEKKNPLEADIEFKNLEIVLNTNRSQVFSTDIFTLLGIDIKSKKILIIKSTNHFYNSFFPFVSNIIYASVNGIYPNNPKKNNYKNLKRKIWPIYENPFK